MRARAPRVHLIGKLDEPVSVGERNRLGAAVDAKFAENALDVRGDRLRADRQLDGDVGLAASLGQEPKDFAFALGQVLPVDTRRSGLTSDQPADPREQLLRSERRRDVVVGTNQQTGCPIVGLRALGRDEDDRDLVLEVVPKRLADLVAGTCRAT